MVVGYSMNQGVDLYLLKTDEFGFSQWSRTYGGDSYDKGYSGLQTEDGGYLVAGWITLAGYHGMYAVRTDSIGDTL
jgi:hypothetical protein